MNETEINYKFDEIRDETSYKLSNVNTNINSLKTRVENLEQNGGGGSNVDLTNLTQQVATNTQNIESLTNNVETNTTNITANATAIETNTQNILTNADNIQSNTDSIEIVMQNITSLTEQVETNTENISTNTANIEANTNDIVVLKNFMDSFKTEVDPYYNPKTFSDYPAGTILQGYARFKQKCNLTKTGNLVTPKFIFSAEENSEGSLHISLEVFGTVNASVLFSLAQNDTNIYSELLSINFVDNNLQTIYKEINDLTLSSGNEFKITLGINPTDASITLKNMHVELIAPNAEVINQISPYNVIYFNNKYYISDCTGETAKIAEINVEDMYNIDNLTWIDTGVVCNQYTFGFTAQTYGSSYLPDKRYDIYDDITTNGSYLVCDNTTIVNENLKHLSWAPSTSTTLTVYGVYKNDYANKFLIDSSFKITTSYSYKDYENIYLATCLNNFLDDNASFSRIYGAALKSNGHFDCALLHASSAIFFEMLFGTCPHVYYESYSSTITIFNVFVKHYDKIVKHRIQYSSSSRFSLLSSEEIGSYEEYFEGANNDYFVVKNGRLSYHKKPLTNEA